jgi:hypothetical protein
MSKTTMPDYHDASYRKTLLSDIHKPQTVRREYTVSLVGLERPSSIVWWIECPFCNDDVKAYLWSLSGGGKRCACGAIIRTGGNAYKLAPVIKSEPVTEEDFADTNEMEGK